MVNYQDLSKPIAYPCASSGRTWQNQHPSIGLTPRKLQHILAQAEQGDSATYFDLCNDMEEKWPRYATVLGVRKRQVASLQLTVEANYTASSGKRDAHERKQHADLIEEFLQTGFVQNHFISILDALAKGVSITEISWKKGEVWLPEKLTPKPPQWFSYVCPERLENVAQQNYDKAIMMRSDARHYQSLAPYRFIVHMPEASPATCHVGGVGRIAAWWYLFYNHSIKDWLRLLEVYGKPFRLGKHAPTASDDEKRRLKNALTSLGSEGSAVIPDNMMIDFLQNAQNKSSSDTYLSMVRYIDERLTEVVLGQTLTTEVRQGSLAAAKVHDGVRHDIAAADAHALIKTLKRDLIKPIIDLNFGVQRHYPILSFKTNELLSGQEKIENILRFIPLGLKVSQEQIRSLIGLQKPSSDDEIL